MIVQANALHLPLADASVHAIVTSPPYWALRTYAGDHQLQTWPDGWLGQLGSEPSPEMYLEHMRCVFRELWRVLRPDGSLWLNMGDSYQNDTKWGGSSGRKNTGAVAGGYQGQRVRRKTDLDRKRPNAAAYGQFKRRQNKKLVGMPWRLALALQDDGWLLRSEVIWHKASPMPESCVDRPTLAHEHIFLLTRQKKYYYDWFGSREPASGNAHARSAAATAIGRRGVHPKAAGGPNSGMRLAKTPAAQTLGRIQAKQNRSFSAAVVQLTRMRRQRTVWHFGSDRSILPHYAAFPRELARRCIQSATSDRGVCRSCGRQWERIIEKTKVGDWCRDKQQKSAGVNRCKFTANPGESGMRNEHFIDPQCIGWRPTCSCNAGDPVPALVLDPFGGTGTTAVAAYAMGRRAILVDVGYQQMQRQRLGLFANS